MIRSEVHPRFDLIPTRALVRIAERYQLGTKYGEWNWEKGLRDPSAMRDAYNHVIDHLMKARDTFLRDFDPTKFNHDDDLAAAAWGCITLMMSQETLIDDYDEKARCYHEEQKRQAELRIYNERQANQYAVGTQPSLTPQEGGHRGGLTGDTRPYRS
jgi:hypothetical protein